MEKLYNCTIKVPLLRLHFKIFHIVVPCCLVTISSQTTPNGDSLLVASKVDSKNFLVVSVTTFNECSKQHTHNMYVCICTYSMLCLFEDGYYMTSNHKIR